MNSLQRLLALLLLLTGNASAENLYKCVSNGGAASWQSAACEHGMRMTRTVAYTLEAPALVPVPVLREAVSPLMGNGTRHRAPPGYGVRPRTHRAKPDACARARELRESTLTRVGLKRNFDLLSKLDSDVRSACR